MFSKETALVLPILIALLEVGVRPKLREALPQPGPGKKKGRRSEGSSLPAALSSLVGSLLPYGIAFLAYFAVRLEVIGGIAPLQRRSLTFVDALIHAPILLMGYLRVMLVPVRLLAFHILDATPSVLDPTFVLSLLAMAALATGALLLWRRRPDLGFAAALVFLPLLPVLYIPAVGVNAFAERYTYLPTGGFTWLLVALAAILLEKYAEGRAPALLVFLAILLAFPCSAAAISRNEIWHD